MYIYRVHYMYISWINNLKSWNYGDFEGVQDILESGEESTENE